MAHWEEVHAQPDYAGVTSTERRGGFYRRYHPDHMAHALQLLDPETTEYALSTTARVGVLGERLRARPLPLLYATLIRSESIASSWVEGERETPRNIMLARLDHERASTAGQRIARNIDAMRTAIERLDGIWTHEDIHRVHQTLLPELKSTGYRHEPVFIGGNSALTARFVPPPHEDVPGYMDDLLSYINTSGDSPLAAALLTHAQFETVHPYPDGNGRVGRALFHGVLHRAGVVTGGVLPLSTALKRDKEAYVKALTAYRYDGNASSSTTGGMNTTRRAATSAYVTAMLDFVNRAVDFTTQFTQQVDEVLDRWSQVLSGHRSDSSVHRAVDVLIQQPVVTIGYLQDELQVTKLTAHTCLKSLVNAGVLHPSGGKLKRANLFQADDVLRILELA
ncbi:MAG TPA: Fic family protein [Flexivirga sp.]|uniref:Fic family protein n=1 Tax=Flexivirga sp. TaxID=1962927 RepID=UPI002C5B92C6|nr:Fic family protein [Flexivirga sp.]HWC22156.1 Fic family protein [Flexivirga sp.]